MVHRVFKYYPKMATVVLTYFLVGFVFVIVGPAQIHKLLEPLGIGGIFIAGMMYAYTLTVGAATVMLPSFAVDYSIEVVTFIGAAGNLLADIILFKFVRYDLKHEIAALSKIPFLRAFFGHSWLARLTILRTLLGFAFIALPFPDEIGIALLATTKIPQDVFRILIFIADMVGIYAVVRVGLALY